MTTRPDHLRPTLFQLVTKKYFNQLKWVLFLICAIPFMRLLWAYQQQQLGINPLAYLTHQTGIWAIIFLIITLSITPLKRTFNQLLTQIQYRYGKRLSDWNWIIRLRRMFGLYSFFYACLHLLVYLWFDQDFELDYIIEDIQDRPFILAGITAFIIYFLLAATSFNYMIRLLKKNWRRLHMLIYPLSLIVLLHFWWLGKPGVYNALPYTIIIALLLLYRVFVFTGIFQTRKGDDGMLVDER